MPERPVEQWKAVRPYRSDVDLLDSFTMQREIEAFALRFFGDAQTDDEVDDLEDDCGSDAAEHHGHYDALDLDPDLARVAVDEADRRIAALDRHGGEHAGQQRTDGAADAMHAEGIQRVVIAELVLEPGRGEKAADAGGDADHD